MQRKRTDLPEGRISLVQAINSNVEALVKALIEQKADINEKDDENQTPLHVAAESHNKTLIIGIIKRLIASKADINQKNNKQQTPLHSALSSRNVEKALILLEAKADPNQSDMNLQTPLHITVKSNPFNIDWYDSYKGTADPNKKSIIRILLDAKADIFAEDKYGKRPSRIDPFAFPAVRELEAVEQRLCILSFLATLHHRTGARSTLFSVSQSSLFDYRALETLLALARLNQYKIKKDDIPSTKRKRGYG